MLFFQWIGLSAAFSFVYSTLLTFVFKHCMFRGIFEAYSNFGKHLYSKSFENILIAAMLEFLITASSDQDFVK